MHHFCPNSSITKHDLLCAWAQVARKRVSIRPVDAPEGGRLLGTRCSVLNSVYSQRPQWRELLAELARLN